MPNKLSSPSPSYSSPLSPSPYEGLTGKSKVGSTPSLDGITPTALGNPDGSDLAGSTSEKRPGRPRKEPARSSDIKRMPEWKNTNKSSTASRSSADEPTPQRSKPEAPAPQPKKQEALAPEPAPAPSQPEAPAQAEQSASPQLQALTEPSPRADETIDDYYQRLFGLSFEEAQDRKGDTNLLSPQQKGALTRERNRLDKHLRSLDSQDSDLPAAETKRLQDLNFVLENAQPFEPGNNDDPNLRWRLPSLASDKMTVPDATSETNAPTPTILDPLTVADALESPYTSLIESLSLELDSSETVVIAGQSYNKGDTVFYTSGAGNEGEYFVLTNTIADPPGLVLQNVETELVFAISGDTDPAMLRPGSIASPAVAPTGEPALNFRPYDETDPVLGGGMDSETYRFDDIKDPAKPPTEGPIDNPPQEPVEEPEPPSPSPDQGPIILYSLDTTETDKALSLLKADEQVDKELQEIRKELFEPKNPSDSRFARLVQTAAKGVRSTFRHPIKAFKYIARSTVTREATRQRYAKGHLEASEGVDFHDALAGDVAKRLDLGEDFLQNGERLLGEDNSEVRAVKDALNVVFQQGIEGTTDRDSTLNDARRILAEAPWLKGGSDQEVHMLKNLEEMYDRITIAVEHESGLAAIDAAYQLKGGEVTLGVNSEAHKTATDRIMEKLTNSRFKALIVNEATIAIAVGVVVNTAGYLARSKGSRYVAGALVGGPVGIALVAGSAGLFAAARERTTLRQERALRMYQIASGQSEVANDSDTAPRSTEVDASLYEMVSARDVLDDFSRLTPDDPATLSSSEAREILASLVALRTNQSIGDESSIDLIKYSSEDMIESEKSLLMVARAEAEILLRNYYSNHPDELPNIAGRNFDEKIAALTELSKADLSSNEITDRDKVFGKLTRKRAFMRGLATAGFAGAGSYISAQMSEHFSHQIDGKTVTAGNLANDPTTYSFKGDTINMPKGYTIQGTSILDGNGKHIVDGLVPKADGGLSPESIALLDAKGIGVEQTVVMHDFVSTREVSYDEFVRLKPERFQQISREVWKNNDTTRFDLNELRGDFKLSENGDIVVATNRLTDTGSFGQGESVAAHSEQLAGRLKILMTPDKGNQSSAVVLDVSPDGTTVIPKGSDLYNLFKVDPTATGIGQVKLDSGFLEIATPGGPTADGSQSFQILATQVGNNPPGTVLITENISTPVYQTTLLVPKETYIPGSDFRAPFIPIAAPLPRRPLDEVIPRGVHEPYLESPYFGYQSGEFSPEDEDRIHRRFSERLRNNPDAVLDPREEIEGYLAGMDPERREALEDLAEQTEAMSNTCEIAVAIPVNGAQEGKNIYKTLQWYSKQLDTEGNPLDPGKFEIVLFVNKPTDLEWDETLSEIERFKSQYPNVPIRVIQREYPPEQARIGRIRRDMTDLTLLRQSRRTVDQDLVVVSNDADCKGLGASYIATILEQTEVQAADGLSGRLEWDPTTNIESPLYHMGVKFMQMLDLIDRHPSPGSGRQARYRYPGANFAFKASMYAGVGGYDEGSVKAEDVVLGRTIKMARRGSDKFTGVGFYGGDNVVYTDSRRGITVFNQGYPPAAQWSKLSFGPKDAAREGAEIEDGINYDLLLSEEPRLINKTRQKRARRLFEAELSRFIEQTLEEYRIISDNTTYHEGMRMPTDVEIAGRAVEAMRIDATIEVSNGEVRVSVVDASKLYSYLRGYRKSGLRNYMARTDLGRVFSGGINEVFPDLEAAA
ncbi:MAG: hypothetical protein NT111_02490 [Patescibacteria group bacterium]|nr:hypothetical protein [Patescibacteria group bacterium]